MAKRIDLTTRAWSDYELLDSGDNMKLERFGSVIVARPETQALWAKVQPELWARAAATFSWEGKNGTWKHASHTPETWPVTWSDMRLNARLTSFKHTGIFPEQAPNWEWSREHVEHMRRITSRAPEILNLFGYTGAASIVAALAGAHVTHVDASKQSLTWARENAESSHVPEGSLRYILDDALAFAKREARRGNRYDGIILDPPAFGRGAKGEVWHIEQDLPALMKALSELLSETPGAFFILNGYAAGYAPQSFLQLVEDVFPNETPEYGELVIAEQDGTRVIPAGIYVRFVRQ